MQPFIKLVGHLGNIEDLIFRPEGISELCSVGVDKQILFWDIRSGKVPVTKANNIHKDDINAVDWSRIDSNYIATGSSDKTVVV